MWVVEADVLFTDDLAKDVFVGVSVEWGEGVWGAKPGIEEGFCGITLTI